MNTKKSSLVKIALIYMLAGAVGFVTLVLLNREEMVLKFLIADLLMTIVVFIFSLIYRNSSVYDAYWSVIPFYFVIWLLVSFVPYVSLNQYLVLGVISVWSWRLTLNWVRSWQGMHHEDWRYRDLAQKSGAWYPMVNFLGIHLFPTLIVFVCLVPVFSVFINELKYPIVFYSGLFISIAGILLEYFADNTLAKFRTRDTKKVGEVLDKGVWAWCRNPNYLGEILFWLGLAVIGISFGVLLFEALRGFMVMLLLFVFISIPMKEKHMKIRYAGFEDYRRRVPMLIPFIGSRKK
jgi:steroid 5-alpha reductase family enzyme